MKRHRQGGFVSILVTMILMVVTSLLVLSFAYLARQNMNRNLNQQLSTQAFYAAESGVNDAIAQLKTDPAKLGDIKDCGNTNRVGQQVIGDPTLNVSYTCVLIDQSPTDLKYDSVSTSASTVVKVTAAGSSQVRISWQDSAGDSTFAPAFGNNFYLPEKGLTGATGLNSAISGFPNHTGILRASIIPASAATSDTNLMSASANFFLYPQTKSTLSNSASFASGQSGAQFVSGECSTTSNLPRYCSATIIGTPPTFYLRLKAVYKPVAATVQALDGSDVAQPITGAQAVVDATGKAQDVLRRIQVRVPLQPSYIYPEFALETADTICKRFSTWPSGSVFINPDHSLYVDSSTPVGRAPANDAQKDQAVCQLPDGPKLNF